ncbi:addiction module antitoxin RelB [Spirochaetia bacterium]|nr:addiction module antitoxin RelB [Spirochaetia bacterium]
MKIRKTKVYKKWVKKLRDNNARYRIFARLERLSQGHLGDCKPIGEGLTEMRIDYGPGYRIYYKDTGKEIIILLCGGDKSTQQEDIEEAKLLATQPLEEDDEN